MSTHNKYGQQGQPTSGCPRRRRYMPKPSFGDSMKLLLAAFFVLALSACSSNMPAPAVSDFVQTEVGGFLMERDAGVKYAMTYKLLKPSASATSYKAVFESTIPNGQPVTSEGEIPTGTSELLVQSPVIPGVKNNHTYSVLLTLYAGDELVATQKDQVKFMLPSAVVAQFGVTEH